MQVMDEILNWEKKMINEGKWQHRFKQNPLEKSFADAWEELNSSKKGRDVIELLLVEEVTERDRHVAATVIQWLGSPVGMNFLTQVLGVDISKQ